MLQLKNPVILVNKGSVIQSAGGQQLAEEVPVQLVGGVSVLGGDSHVGATTNSGHLAEDEGTRKRREVLARRPSYRKILNELSMPQHHDSSGLATLQVNISLSTPKRGSHHTSGVLLTVPILIHMNGSFIRNYKSISSSRPEIRKP